MDLPSNYMIQEYEVHTAFLLSTVLQNHAKPNLHNTASPKDSTVHSSGSLFNCSTALRCTAAALP